MKKSLILVCLIVIVLVGGCRENKSALKVLLPGATPLISIGNLLDHKDFSFEVVNGQDPLSAAFTKGEYDMIIAPLNLGAKLHMNGVSGYKLEAIITTNNTYLISRSEIASINDLNNEKVVSFGTGSTPWIVLQANIRKNSLSVSLIERSSVSDAAELFIADTEDAKYYLSDEPTVTVLRVNKGINLYSLDLSALLSEEAGILIHACLFVNDKSNISAESLKVIANNIAYLNEKPSEYAQSILNKNQYFTSLGLEVIKQAIPKSNITYLKASENKEAINQYYALLNTYNPNILGGSTPNESFYN